MKFFIDSANIDEIREAASLGILDGVTTNPSLVAKEAVAREITKEAVVRKASKENIAKVNAKQTATRETTRQILAREIKKGTVGILAYLAGGNGKILLSGKITKIGRDRTSDVVVKGMLVGRTAATISRRPDGFYLSYVGGAFKPKVNSMPPAAPMVCPKAPLAE